MLLPLLLTLAQDATPAPPDVLVLLADDVAWTDISPHVPTPALDRLMAEGLTFRNAYVMPVCSSTRYALVFGRYPRRDGIGGLINGFAPPSAENPCPDPALYSLADLFHDAGYATGLFGKWHLGGLTSKPAATAPLEHGFDTWRAGTLANLPAGPRSEDYFHWTRIDDGVETVTNEYATTAVTEALLEWWAEHTGPKLAFVPFHAAHFPLHVPPRELLPADLPPPVGPRAMFEAMVMALDRSIGRMLDAVDLSRTLVVFLSDNGTPPAARPPGTQPRQVKGSVFEGGIHVPLIVAGPGVAHGKESDALVHVVDLLATLADSVGRALPAGAAEDSVSFAGAFPEGAPFAGEREWVFSEVFEGRRDQMAVRTRTHKLVVTPRSEELFDLGVDPDEEHPLDLEAESSRAALERLRSILRALPPRKTP